MALTRISLVCATNALIFFVFTQECCSTNLFRLGRAKHGFLGLPRTTYSGPLPPDMWFEQKLDHFNPQDTRIWYQRYFVNDTFYKPGGPVFLQIGGEGTANPIWMVTGSWISYAQQYNALCFQVEHRFYGKSHPTSDISTENLRFLSSEQALEDLANFRVNITEKMNLQGAKWIAFGGSYPGSLAAWFRVKYPHLVHASVASSAPLVATADFSDYLRVVKASLLTAKQGEMCVTNIQNATDYVSNMIQNSDGRIIIKKLFNLCDDIDPKNSNDISNLFSVLSGNFEGVVQYNKDNRAFEGGPGSNITIDTLCDIMAQTSNSPADNYASVNSLLLKTYSQKCLDFTYANMIKGMQATDWESSASEGGRQWTYQTCTEFGYYQTSSYKDQPFGHGFPLEFWTKQCQDIFGPIVSEHVLDSGISFTNANYGGLGLKVTRIVFPNGSIDPWHALSVTKSLSPNATAIFINGTAHCANMYPEGEDDSEQLKAARLFISQTIGVWLKT